MAGQWLPFPPRTFLWDTTVTTYRGCPVVMSSTAEQVTNPAGTNADIIVGVAWEDAGPNALASGVNEKAIEVVMMGVVPMYAKGAITAGTPVKVGATISATIPGYATTQTVQTVTAATKAGAGVQPYPIVGVALTASSADGDIVYVMLSQFDSF